MRWIAFIFIVITSLTACSDRSDTQLTIACAANMQYPIKAIERAFTEATGITCETVISSSGKLTAQIKSGAPFDIFLSADMIYPNDLHQNDLTYDAPQIYAYGHLVLWTMNEEFKLSPDILVNKQIRHIAMPNPQIAPYGKAAKQVLDYYQLNEQLQSKFVFGENISQTNQFIQSEVADIGFTAKSVILSPLMKNKGQYYPLDANTYQLIEQGIVLLKTRPEQEQASRAFYNFLFSDKGKEILTNFGYDLIRT